MGERLEHVVMRLNILLSGFLHANHEFDAGFVDAKIESCIDRVKSKIGNMGFFHCVFHHPMRFFA